MYVLGHDYSFHDLINFLNLLNELLYLLLFGTNSQIFGLSYFADCKS